MTWLVQPLPPQELRPAADPDETGFGTLTTGRGNLPLDQLDVRVSITGLIAGVEVVQGFRNPFDQPLEATYVFPLPDRAAVTGMRMEADGHTVVAELQERAQARATYDAAIAAGQRASIAEEDRPDVFTMRVGNILPGERVVIRLSLVQPLPYADGEAEFRFPLVVAPRYIPGEPLTGTPVGTGWAPDTEAVPDASRITPPVLLPGLPNPVPLTIEVDVDPAGLPLQGVRSSLHAVVDQPATQVTGGAGQDARRIRIEPGERADRDFVLRLRYAAEQATATAATLGDGTFRLTVLPPLGDAPARPRDVVLLLDRSGSMAGWKMVAARRAAARIVDTLGEADRFAVLGFDDRVEGPAHLPAGLVAGSDRNRYRAVEHLARLDARGGTELLEPLVQAIGLLRGATGTDRDRVLVLVTDGQVGNEDEILRQVTAGLAGVRVHVVGVDEAVNAGFLARLAVIGGGRCELVESEDRLDEATEHIHRRIAAPLLTGIELQAQGMDATRTSPRRLPALFPGVPLVITGRLAEGAGDGPAQVLITGRRPDGQEWSAQVPVTPVTGAPARSLTATWARAHLRDLEDAHAATYVGDPEQERAIIATSLRFGVLCRFTAFVAVDERVVTDGAAPHRVTQPVEPARGWDMLAEGAPGAVAAGAMTAGGGMAGAVLRQSLLSGTGTPPPAPAVAPMPAPGGPMPRASAMPMAAMPKTAGARGGGLGAAFAGRLASAAGGLRARRVSSQEPAAFWRGGGGPADQLAEIRERLAVEADRLRSASSLPDVERAGLLADLGTRLAVLVTDLRQAGAERTVVTRLEDLVRELAVCESAVPAASRLQELWRTAVDTLDALSRP